MVTYTAAVPKGFAFYGSFIKISYIQFESIVLKLYLYIVYIVIMYCCNCIYVLKYILTVVESRFFGHRTLVQIKTAFY